MISILLDIKKYIRYRRFIKKVREQLPRYHPGYGSPLNWKIYLQRTVIRFDPKTGEETYDGKLPKLIIEQKNEPYNGDDKVYGFDWKKKKIYTKENRRWR